MHSERMCQGRDLRICFVDKPCLADSRSSRHTQGDIRSTDRRDIRGDKCIFRHCIAHSGHKVKDNKGRVGLVLALKLNQIDYQTEVKRRPKCSIYVAAVEALDDNC